VGEPRVDEVCFLLLDGVVPLLWGKLKTIEILGYNVRIQLVAVVRR